MSPYLAKICKTFVNNVLELRCGRKCNENKINCQLYIRAICFDLKFNKYFENKTATDRRAKVITNYASSYRHCNYKSDTWLAIRFCLPMLDVLRYELHICPLLCRLLNFMLLCLWTSYRRLFICYRQRLEKWTTGSA